MATMAHRLQSRASLHGATFQSPVHLRSSIGRSRAPAFTQTRSLWWWSRQGNEWSSSYDELDERVRRHQKILRHRYSKMLRRRSMWERDASSRFAWPWRMTGQWLGGQVQDVQNMSSTQPPRAKLEEQQNDRQGKDEPLATFHKNFESFKQAVDRAIEKDPYGALFGRRLQGPASPNNSSWTSFSWIWDPKEIKEDQVQSKPPSSEPKKASNVRSPTDAPVTLRSSEASSQPIPSAQSSAQEEYEYDPISMRKVPKSQATSSKAPNRNIFDTLFSEHGADIPVKTYKPPMIFGHGAPSSEGKHPRADIKENRKAGFETSRKHEFQALKASTLGNTIDTSTAFSDNVMKPEPSSAPEPPKRKSRKIEESSEDPPLFSGTTYENKSAELLANRKPKSTWLLDEGFKSSEAHSAPNETFDVPVKKFHANLGPSIDRTTAKKPSPTIIQPALDRHLGSQGPQATRHVRSSLDEKTEDVDLLRPHMVRASTKTARTTRQDVETQKREERSKLETDFTTRQSAKEAKKVDTASYRFSGKLDNVWRHVQNYPEGIVAKTITSMGIANDSPSTHEKPHTQSMDSHGKPMIKDESFSNVVSLNKSPKKSFKPVTTFTPSTEVLRMELLNTMQAESAAKPQDDQWATLAKDIRKIYQEEKGTIGGQQPGDACATELAKSAGQLKSLHPLRTATVKEGVPRYPAIEAHVSTFEPEFARLVDDVKKVRREMHEAHIHYRHLKDRLQRSPWSEGPKPAAPGQTFIMLKEEPTEEDYPQGLDGPFSAPPPESKQEKVQEPAAEPELKPKVQEPVFTPPGSSIWNDEQPPPMSELVDFRSRSNPYVLLRYRQKHNTVEVVPMSEAPSNTNPGLEGFNRLDNAAKFFTYFPALLKEGYDMVSGAQDFVLFKRSKVTLRPSVKMEEIAKQYPEPAKKPDSIPPKPLKPTTSPRKTQRLREEQAIINSFIKVDDVKHTHGINSFEVHSVLSQLAADVDASRAEGAEGIGGILGKLKALRSKALTMDSTEFNKNAEALIKEVQVARAAQPIKEVTPAAPVASTVAEPTETQKMEAATVLDEIPQPAPGPAAPTAPPSRPIPRPIIRQEPVVKQEPVIKPEPIIRQEPTVKQERVWPQEPSTEQDPRKRYQPLSNPGEGPKSRVRRQEDSFTGAIKSPPYRPVPASSSAPVAPEARPEPQPKVKPDPEVFYDTLSTPRVSAWRRFTRLVRRTIVTVVGAGVGAYVIGVIAEGLGAEQQKVGQVGDGPRRKVVLPASTRPGIYSTESSR